MNLRGILFLFCALAGHAIADDRVTDHNLHGWFTYFGDHAFGSSKWGVHLEGQWRRHDAVLRWQQGMLRPGLNYEVNRKVMLTTGYLFQRSYRYGEFPASRKSNEHRLWHQALLRYSQGNIKWFTRLRLENRFLDTLDATGRQYFRYENRFRALQQVRVPVTKRSYVTAYNELWFYLKPYQSSSVIDQNRAYGAWGIFLNDNWRIETGYLNQAVLQRSGRVLESNHTLMFTLFSSAPFQWKR